MIFDFFPYLSPSAHKDNSLAKPNYQYEKRQKDLAKKKKQEEKRQKKIDKSGLPLTEADTETETPNQQD